MIQYREGNSIVPGDPQVIEAQRQAAIEEAARQAAAARSKSLALTLIAAVAAAWVWFRSKSRSKPVSKSIGLLGGGK